MRLVWLESGMDTSANQAGNTKSHKRYPCPNDPVSLCVEVVSPPDRIGKLFGKCEEYHKWGVPYCWVIDPERKIAWEYFPDDLEPRKVAENLTAGVIQLPLSDVFK
jgi:Uma2 family endonuclease